MGIEEYKGHAETRNLYSDVGDGFDKFIVSFVSDVFFVLEMMFRRSAYQSLLQFLIERVKRRLGSGGCLFFIVGTSLS